MKIASIVLNALDNDARVLKIGKTLAKQYKVVFIALINRPLNSLFIHDSINDQPIIRFSLLSKKLTATKIRESKLLRKKRNIIAQLWHIPRDIRWDIFLNNRLFRVLISENFDCYYCNDFNTLIAGYFASRRKRAKLIYDTHELWVERSGARRDIYYRMKRNIEYHLEHFLIKRCDLVITVSDGIADELVRRYSIPRPVVIRNLDEKKPLPPYEKRMETRRELGIPEDSVLLVYQGALTDSRGIPELLEAMNSLPDNVHLLLMGPEPEDDIMKSIINNPRIHYPGLVPLECLFEFTASGDIGIHPMKRINLNHLITCPNKFSQYMNAGLILLMSDIMEARYIVDNFNIGFLFNSDSPENIALAVSGILREDTLQLKNASRKAFIEKYNWVTIENDLKNNVQGIMESSN